VSEFRVWCGQPRGVQIPPSAPPHRLSLVSLTAACRAAKENDGVPSRRRARRDRRRAHEVRTFGSSVAPSSPTIAPSLFRTFPRRRQAPPERTRGRSPFHLAPVEQLHPPALHGIAVAATGAVASRRVMFLRIRKEEADSQQSTESSLAGMRSGPRLHRQPDGGDATAPGPFESLSVPPPAPRGAARPGVPFRHGTVPSGW